MKWKELPGGYPYHDKKMIHEGNANQIAWLALPHGQVSTAAPLVFNLNP